MHNSEVVAAAVTEKPFVQANDVTELLTCQLLDVHCTQFIFDTPHRREQMQIERKNFENIKTRNDGVTNISSFGAFR